MFSFPTLWYPATVLCTLILTSLAPQLTAFSVHPSLPSALGSSAHSVSPSAPGLQSLMASEPFILSTYRRSVGLRGGGVTALGAANKKMFEFEEAKKMARSYGFSSQKEWEEYKCPGAYSLPRRPDEVYADEWKGWDDWLGTMLPFEEAREKVRALKLESEESYRALSAKSFEGIEGLEGRVPSKPDRYPGYVDVWKGWEDWLGA